MILHQECRNLDFPTEDYDGLEYIFQLGTSLRKPYAILRLEIVPTLVLIHPNLLLPTKDNIKLLKHEMFKVGLPVLRKYNFTEAYFTGENPRFIKLLVGDNFRKIDTIKGKLPLYEYDLGAL
mgnify:CR=1 FL=1